MYNLFSIFYIGSEICLDDNKFCEGDLRIVLKEYIVQKYKNFLFWNEFFGF